MSGSASGNAFTIWDMRRLFSGLDHNPRTHHAFECGVHRRIYGGEFVYAESAPDYARAERSGYLEASRRLEAGERFRCGECDSLHNGEAALHELSDKPQRREEAPS